METENLALVQRPAPFSWEAGTILARTVQAANPVRVTFPRPVVLVSMYPSVSSVDPDDTLIMPTIDDIFVQIEQEFGQEKRLTSRFDTVQPGGIASLPQVTLGSFRDTTGGARTMEMILGGPGGAQNPVLEFTYSWKRPLVANTVPYQAVYVSLVLHTRFL